MKMNRVLLALAAASLATAGAASAGIEDTKHDLSNAGAEAGGTNVTEICVFCHTPHQSEGPPQINTDPLWNHEASAETGYGVYASDTLDATVTELTNTTGEVSNLCLSCHDGTIAVGSMYNAPNSLGTATVTYTAGGNLAASGLLTGAANMGTDLTNDHPVNFIYDANLATTLDGELVAPFSTDWVVNGTVPLFGGTLQCASCHDPHDGTNAPFLVVSNTNSALCTQCHVK